VAEEQKGMWSKEQVVQLAGRAWEKAALQPESVFMFRFLQFQFSYDDARRECRIECPVTPAMYNPFGIVHGGIYTFIADTAIGHLNFRYKDAPYVSLELKTSYLKSTQTGKLIATARYVREGNRVLFAEATVEDEHGERLSVTTGTFYRVGDDSRTKK